MQAFIPGVLFDMNRCVPDGIWKPGRPCPYFTNSKIISAINMQTVLEERRRVTVRTPAVTLCPMFHAHRVPRLPEILKPSRTNLSSSPLAGLNSTDYTQCCTCRAFYCSKGTEQEHKDMQAPTPAPPDFSFFSFLSLQTSTTANTPSYRRQNNGHVEEEEEEDSTCL